MPYLGGEAFSTCRNKEVLGGEAFYRLQKTAGAGCFIWKGGAFPACERGSGGLCLIYALSGRGGLFFACERGSA